MNIFNESGFKFTLLSIGSHIASIFAPDNISTISAYVALISGLLGIVLLVIKIIKEFKK